MTKKETNFKTVTKEEFYEYIHNYPNKLGYARHRICEPEQEIFFDSSIKGHDEKPLIVAKIIRDYKYVGNKTVDDWSYYVREVIVK